MERLTREWAVGDRAADPLVARIDHAGRKIVDFPAFADVLSFGQRFIQHVLKLATAPDLGHQARLKFQRVK